MGIDVIQQFVEKVADTIPWVVASVRCDLELDGFGFPIIKQRPVGDTKNVHYLFRTKKYRDKDCAAYKLVEGLDSILSTKDVSRLYWRRSPEVLGERYWAKGYWLYVGFARLTILLRKDDPDRGFWE
jgi:hypothetical protein